jgi:Mg2+ and Co2+ transporter CorA
MRQHRQAAAAASAVYRIGRRIASPETLVEALRSLPDESSMAWIGLYRPAEDRLLAVAEQFGLPELAVEDAIVAHQRPKLELYGDPLFVVLRDDDTARLWDPTTGQPIGNPLTGHTSDVVDVAFSPDGTRLATTSHDRTARLWDSASYANPLKRICAQYGPIDQREWDRYAPGEPFPQVCP